MSDLSKLTVKTERMTTQDIINLHILTLETPLGQVYFV